MNTGDLIGIYGAVVATIVAAVQIREHFRTPPVLNARLYDPFSLPSKSIDVFVTNLTATQIQFAFVGVGYSFRPWFSPWRRKLDEATGLRLSRSYGASEPVQVYDEIGPSETLEGAIWEDNTEWRKRLKWFGIRGFDFRLTFNADHSFSNKGFMQVLA